MMRSIPPASSLLAEMPVPAPPPMIGSPRATLARRRLTMAARELVTRDEDAAAAFFGLMAGGSYPSSSPGLSPEGSNASACKPTLASACREHLRPDFRCDAIVPRTTATFALEPPTRCVQHPESDQGWTAPASR